MLKKEAPGFDFFEVSTFLLLLLFGCLYGQSRAYLSHDDFYVIQNMIQDVLQTPGRGGGVTTDDPETEKNVLSCL